MADYGSTIWGRTSAVAVVVMTVLIVVPAAAFVLLALTSYLQDLAVWLVPFEAGFVAEIMFAVRAIVVSVCTCLVYYWWSNWVNARVCGESPRGVRLREAVEPWLFIAPACLLAGLFLIYPAFATVWTSFMSDVPVVDEAGKVVVNELGKPLLQKGFVGLLNYEFLLSSDDFWLAIRNSVLWLIVVPTMCVVLGLAIAALTDRIVWGNFAKSLVFVPLAISLVGASVIWRNIYAAGGAGGYQTGLLNALLAPFGVPARYWYEWEFWGNFFMMSILVWVQTGFAMVLFSAALRGVPEETIEAGRMDGASELGIFFNITLPQIYGTVMLVWTTLVIIVLKVFDIPFALTANKSDKLLLATLMEQMRTAQREEEIAAAVAVVLMLTIIPIMAFNGWRAWRGARS